MNRPAIGRRCFASGIGMVDDAAHRKLCLQCAKQYWIEQHPKLHVFGVCLYVLYVLSAVITVAVLLSKGPYL